MKYILQRFSESNESTLGLMLKIKDNRLEFQSYTLEDEHRSVKLAGDTCIPAGLYEIKYRETVSDKTKSYRKRYSWFNFHLELQNVPDFKYIYVHVGNDDDDTNGCILVADTANNNQIEDGFIGRSGNAFKRFYLDCEDAFLNNEKIFIEVRDLLV